MPELIKNNVWYSVLGIVIAFLITSFFSFVYTTHDEMLIISSEFKYFRRDIDKINHVLSVEERFTKLDSEKMEARLVRYIDAQVAINQHNCAIKLK